MKRFLQISLPLLIVMGTGLTIWYFIATQEVPEKRVFRVPPPQVTVRPVEPSDYQTVLHSQGTVRARTESSLIPEVRGRVLRVSENFQEGAFFEEGDVLLEIDDRDYQAELIVAEAALAQAELAFMQEQARYDQAQRDWERLNPGQVANELALREPQIKQARAAAASAKARMDTAKLNFERCKITAPFAGRVLSKKVDVGQFVTTGNELARIYAVDIAEVRLPLAASQFALLQLPSTYRGSKPTLEQGPKVTLTSGIGGQTFDWEGRVVRAEGSIDESSRQIFVVAQIDDPYGFSKEGRPPLKVGTFVEAKIEGAVLENVFVFPRQVFRENSYVLVVDQDKKLTRRSVDVVWETDKEIVASSGLSSGDMLCLTNVPYAVEGGTVVATLEGQAAPKSNWAGGSGGAPNGASPVAARIDGVMTHFGDKLPEELKTQLLSVKSGDSGADQMPAVMGMVKAWADKNGLSMPSMGAGPRS